MPALGLLLEHPVFDSYNSKLVGHNAKLSSPASSEWRPPIDFEPFKDEIEAFKRDHIYASMRGVEEKTGL